MSLSRAVFSRVCCVLLAATTQMPAQSAELEEIGRQSGAEEQATMTFPAGTTLKSLPFGEIAAYEGGWRDGRAHGAGRVEFAKPVGHMGYCQPDTYEFVGEFRDGRAVSGSYVERSQTCGEVRRLHDDGYQVTLTVDGLEAMVITRIGNDVPLGVMASTETYSVRLTKYSPIDATKPSRIYFGRGDASGLDGAWVDLPWWTTVDEQAVGGYGARLEYTDKSGGTYSCTYVTQRDEFPWELDGFRSHSSTVQRLAMRDFRFGGSGQKCQLTTADNWIYSFDVGAFVPGATQSVTYNHCITPEGTTGELGVSVDGKVPGCDRPREKKKKRDFVTNIFREGKRTLDRGIDQMNRFFAGAEKMLCRATGTKEGENCSVAVEGNVTWSTDNPTRLSPAQQIMRQTVLSQVDQVNAAFDAIPRTQIGDAIGLSTALNGICSVMCSSPAQRKYSETLLAELGRAGKISEVDLLTPKVRSLQRETASVLRGGMVVLLVGATAPAFVQLRQFTKQLEHTARFSLALDTLNAMPPPKNLDEERRRSAAFRMLYHYKYVVFEQAALEGARFNHAALMARFTVTRALTEKQIKALTIAVAVAKTGKELVEFVEKYKDAESVEVIYDALIREQLEPLGIPWPPRVHDDPLRGPHLN